MKVQCSGCGVMNEIDIQISKFGPENQDRFDAECAKCGKFLKTIRKCFGISVKVVEA